MIPSPKVPRSVIFTHSCGFDFRLPKTFYRQEMNYLGCPKCKIVFEYPAIHPSPDDGPERNARIKRVYDRRLRKNEFSDL